MKFVVDGMLGGLARWLRILGHHVLYDSKLNDTALLTRAATQEMTLLTRDVELHRRAVSKGIPALLVSGESEDERLAQVSQYYGISLTIDMDKTLCPACGSFLRKASRKEVSRQVPPASSQIYAPFWKCRNSDCGKIYWRGSHWKQINQTLTRARNLTRFNP
jgi:hypothetical protein